MALANVPISTGTRTYSGIEMKYTMQINSITNSNGAISVNYTLVSKKVSGSGYPYASIQSYLNGSKKYDSDYNSYSSWPGAEGTKTCTHSTGKWGENFTFQVRGSIGGNALTGSISTVKYNTLSYTSSQGTVPASYKHYTGYTATVGSLTNLPSSYHFDYWEDASGNHYKPGDKITFNQKNIALTAHLTLLKPSITSCSIDPEQATRNSVHYNALTAEPANSTFQYKVGNRPWTTANPSGGDISGLDPGVSYVISFKAIYLNLDSNIETRSAETHGYPDLESINNTTLDAGSPQTLTIYNPEGDTVVAAVYYGNQKVKEATATTGTSITITLSNTEIGNIQVTNRGVTTYAFAKITSGTFTYKIERCSTSSGASLSHGSTTKTATISLSGDLYPTVDSSKISNFFTYIKTDADFCGGNSNVVDTTHYIIGKTKVKIKLNSNSNPFTPKYNTTIDHYEIHIRQGENIEEAQLDTYYPLGDDVYFEVPAIGYFYVEVTAIDKRNQLNNCSTPFWAAYSYSEPAITITSLERQGGFSETALISTVGSWSPNINYINKSGTGSEYYASVTLKYREVGSSTWTIQALDTSSYLSLNWTSKIISNISFDTSKSYEMCIVAKDKYKNSTTSDIAILPRGEPTMFVDIAQNGVGINCFPVGAGLWTKGNIHVMRNDEPTVKFSNEEETLNAEIYYNLEDDCIEFNFD